MQTPKRRSSSLLPSNMDIASPMKQSNMERACTASGLFQHGDAFHAGAGCGSSSVHMTSGRLSLDPTSATSSLMPNASNGNKKEAEPQFRISPVLAHQLATKTSSLTEDSRAHEMLGSKIILEREEFTGTRFIYEGFVSKCDLSRVTEYQESKTGLTRRVFEFLAIDNSGPIGVKLFDEALDTFSTLYANSETQHFAFRMENFRLNGLPRTEWNGDSLTTIRILQGVPNFPERAGTIITKLQSPTSPYLTTEPFTCPNPSVCISSFARLRSCKTPCRLTLRGTIINVRGRDYTQSLTKPEDKREFDIIDDDGLWIHCVAFGTNATNPSLNEYMEVVLFFLTGRASQGNYPASMQLRSLDATVFPLRQKHAGTTKTNSAEITLT